MNGRIPSQLDVVLTRDSSLEESIREVLGYALARGLQASTRARLGTALHLVADELLPAESVHISARIQADTAQLDIRAALNVDSIAPALPSPNQPSPTFSLARALTEWIEVEHSLEGTHVRLLLDSRNTHFEEESSLERAEYLTPQQVEEFLALARGGELREVALPAALAIAAGRLLTHERDASPNATEWLATEAAPEATSRPEVP